MQFVDDGLRIWRADSEVCLAEFKIWTVDGIEGEGVASLRVRMGVGLSLDLGKPLSDATGRRPAGNEPGLAGIAPAGTGKRLRNCSTVILS